MKYGGLILKILLGILPVFIGGLIYITYRTDSLHLFHWLNDLGFSEIIYYLRNNQKIQSVNFPEWVINSLPDSLWLFSFNFCLLSLWNFKITTHSAFWIFSAPGLGIFSELGQLTQSIPGTFDFVDLLLLILATFFSFSFVTYFKTK